MLCINVRSSRSQMFFKIGVLKNFSKFTGQRLWQSLFLKKVSGFRAVTLLKRRIRHSCVFQWICETFKYAFFYIEHLRWLLLKRSLFFRTNLHNHYVFGQSVHPPNPILPTSLHPCLFRTQEYKFIQNIQGQSSHATVLLNISGLKPMRRKRFLIILKTPTKP